MKIYDISMDIFYEMPVYKGKEFKRPIIETDMNYETGSVYESRLNMNLHTGTHIDAPLHILKDGKNLDGLKLERVITRCKVLDFTYVDEKITREHLSKKEISEGDFILLKTKNSYDSNQENVEKNFIYLDETGAEYLKDKKVSGVGIDALGIERDQPGHPTHRILFNSDIIIMECLMLKNVDEGEYMLFAAPIKVKGVEAAPVRAVLIKDI